MTRAEQEFFALDNRGEEGLLVSSTHPVWTRQLQRLEQRGLARRTRIITAVENGRQVVLGAEFAIDRELVALRLTPRRKPSDAQKAAAARARNARLRSESSAPAEIRDDSESGSALAVRTHQVITSGQTSRAAGGRRRISG